MSWATGRKEIFAEDMAVAAAMGLLALVVAATSLAVDAGVAAKERSALTELSKRPVSSAASLFDDPHFQRIFRIEGAGPALYGAVLSLESECGEALVAAVFSTKGELEALRVISDSSPLLPYKKADWLLDFLGKGADHPYPAAKSSARDPSAISGATVSFTLTGLVLGRVSSAIRDLARSGR